MTNFCRFSSLNGYELFIIKKSVRLQKVGWLIFFSVVGWGFISLIFCVLLAMKTRLLRSIEIPQMGGGGFLTKSVYFRPCQIFTKIDQIWKTGFSWRIIWYSGVGMTSDQNSVVPRFRRRGAEGVKTAMFFWTNWYTIHSCVT